MPLKPRYAKIRTAMIKQYGKKKGESVFWATSKKKKWDVEQKAYIFYSTELKMLDDNTVSGYITTGDKDLVNDIVTPNCMVDMLNQLRERNIKLDVEHESFRGKSEVEQEINKSIIPVAKTVDAALDNKGVKVITELNPHHSRFSEVKNSIKDKFLDAFSIAFVPIKYAFKTAADGSKTRLLEKINLLNIAFTGNPVNPNASFTNIALKSLEDGLEFDADINESEIEKLIGGITMAEKEKPEGGKPEGEKPEGEKPEGSAKPEGVKPKGEKPEGGEEKPAETAGVEAKALSKKVDALTKSVTNLKALIEKKDKEGEKGGEEEKPEGEDVKEQLKAVAEKVAELDKVLSTPQFKARMEQMQEGLEAEVETAKTKGPLDDVR